MSIAFVERGNSTETSPVLWVFYAMVSSYITVKTQQLERVGLNYCNFPPAELFNTVMGSHISHHWMVCLARNASSLYSMFQDELFQGFEIIFELWPSVCGAGCNYWFPRPGRKKRKLSKSHAGIQSLHQFSWATTFISYLKDCPPQMVFSVFWDLLEIYIEYLPTGKERWIWRNKVWKLEAKWWHYCNPDRITNYICWKTCRCFQTCEHMPFLKRRNKPELSAGLWGYLCKSG